MPSITYRTRLQQVLSDIAKQDKDFAFYADVERKICAQFTSSNARYGPRYRHFIVDAVVRENRARRIHVDYSLRLPRIVITDSGKRFYRELGSFPLYDAEHPNLRYMNIKKLRHHSRVLRGVIRDIHDAFFEFHDDLAFSADGEDLPQAILNLGEDIKLTQARNEEVNLEICFEEGDKERLLERLSL